MCRKLYMVTCKMFHTKVLLLLTLLNVVIIDSYKILVVPWSSGFNSRLLNVQKIADILAEDGHEITVLTNTRVEQHSITKLSKVVNFHVPNDSEDINNVYKPQASAWNVLSFLDNILGVEFEYADHLLADKKVLDILERENFDLIFADNLSFGSYALSSKLNVTTIYYYNFLVTSYNEMFFPIFPSFICILPGMTCNDENMTFLEKVGNTGFKFIANYYISPGVISRIEDIAKKNGITLKTPIHECLKNKIVVVNMHYALDTPMPTMPHVFPISGLFHKEPSPLPKQFADILKSSEPHGTILMSFGTLVKELDTEKADMFGRVLGRLPHKVIWRFTGTPPKALKQNTHLVNWFPQNDLLGNPLLKMFITHCGVSSMFESSQHGVPVVAMPLFADQESNAAKLTKKLKMGVKLDFYTVTEEQFEKGVLEVLRNPIYEENAKKASFLLNDHVVSPQQQLRHLVNFTIKSGRAPHLFHPYAVDMNWIQFYGIDVLSFLLLVFMGISFLLYIILKMFVKMITKICFGKSKQA